MKETLAFALLIIICCAMIIIAVISFDKHAYEGVDIIGQSGDILQVTLDDEPSGSDLSCYSASLTLEKVALQSGYRVQVVGKPNEWIIFNGKPMSALELRNVIECGNPY